LIFYGDFNDLRFIDIFGEEQKIHKINPSERSEQYNEVLKLNLHTLEDKCGTCNVLGISAILNTAERYFKKGYENGLKCKGKIR
jgi:hypothetical protein